MKKSLVAALVLVLVLIAGSVFAEAYPDEMMQKITAMKVDAEAKKDMPATIEGMKNVSADEAMKMLKAKKAVFLDNRVKSQYDTEKIQGAEWFYADDLIKKPEMALKLDKSKEYVLYCNGVHCWRSPATGMMLKHLGFTKLYWFRDGIPEWKKKGYPIE